MITHISTPAQSIYTFNHNTPMLQTGTGVHTTTTTTVLQPFVRDYPGEPVPEETFTHPPC